MIPVHSHMNMKCSLVYGSQYNRQTISMFILLIIRVGLVLIELVTSLHINALALGDTHDFQILGHSSARLLSMSVRGFTIEE